RGHHACHARDHRARAVARASGRVSTPAFALAFALASARDEHHPGSAPEAPALVPGLARVVPAPAAAVYPAVQVSAPQVSVRWAVSRYATRDIAHSVVHCA